MQTRLKTLERLRSLYGVVAHLHGVALEQASAKVREAETEIDMQRAVVRRSDAASRLALDVGDSAGWRMYEAQRGFVERGAARLLVWRQERERVREAAAEIYHADRVQFEQVQSVLGKAKAEREHRRARREQEMSDDRFLSRQRWWERQLATKAKGAR